MQIIYSKKFEKRLAKLPLKVEQQFERRLELFLKNPSNALLGIHPLKGVLSGYRSFSVTGDYRVIFKYLSTDSVKFIDIGTHSQLY